MGDIFEQLGINEVIKDIQSSHEKLSLDLKKIIFTIIASRFVLPSSKLKVFEHWQKLFYPGMLEGDLQLQHLYRAMDLLSTHKEKIERSLYWHGQDLLSMEVDIVLYDLTTLRFESVRTDLEDLRQFGYSKEMRSDCTQVIFGLLVNRDGIPLGFEVYPGNTYEGHTLSDIVNKMREKTYAKKSIDRNWKSRPTPPYGSGSDERAKRGESNPSEDTLSDGLGSHGHHRKCHGAVQSRWSGGSPKNPQTRDNVPKLRTSSKIKRSKLKAVKEWCRKNRHKAKLLVLWKIFCSKIRGHIQYYGVSFNARWVTNFVHQARRSFFKWMNRRSQRKSMNWESFSKFEKAHPLPRIRVYHRMF